MRTVIKQLEEGNQKMTTAMGVDSFLKLPRKCQEMFFSYMETFGSRENNHYLPFYIHGFEYELCESPIEIIFNMAFSVLTTDLLDYDFTLLQQEEIHTDEKKYRVDFLFDTEENSDFYWFENELKLVIECDGHDYHKTTKAQVKKDNERDCDLKMSGYDVLHFSGSQIYNEPWKCAERVYDYILSKVGKVTPHLPYETPDGGDGADAEQDH